MIVATTTTTTTTTTTPTTITVPVAVRYCHKQILRWNNEVYLVKTSHVTFNSQSEFFISA